MTDKEMYNIVHKEPGLQQSEPEILWALDEMRRFFAPHKPKVFLEIGCAFGASLCMWSQLLDKDGLLIGISPCGFIAKRTEEVRTVTGKPLEWINDASESPDTMNRLIEILDGRLIDAIFLDTLHTYKQSKKEFSLYYPLVNTPGIFGFHDIVQGGLVSIYNEPCTGDFWHEIKYNYDYIEKHNKRSGCNFGIGLIFNA